MDIQELVNRVDSLLTSSSRVILGIAGPPGAGKSTVAKQLVSILNKKLGNSGSVIHLPLDGYHFTNTILNERGLRNIKGAPETFDVDSYIDLLQNVRNFPDQTWHAPDFSRETDEPVPNAIIIKPDVRLVITEGNYLLLQGKWAPIKQLCDETWFLEVDPVVERKRLISRQVDEAGRTMDEAIEWVDRSDLANATLVREQSADPSGPRVIVNDITMVGLARKIAREAHTGQVDKLGVEYIRHPEAVAKKFEESGEWNRAAAAWLHDVVEDSDITSNELLERGVPSRVVEVVDLLTRKDSISDDEYYEQITKNSDALAVKLADMRHNTDPDRQKLLDEPTRTRLINKYVHAAEMLGQKDFADELRSRLIDMNGA